MKPIGPIIKQHIEERRMRKTEIADKVGITYNYLSTIFHKSSIDAALLEKICIAIGLNPSVFFETAGDTMTNSCRDINAETKIGNATVPIDSGVNVNQLLNEKERIIAEKERTIRILMQTMGMKNEP